MLSVKIRIEYYTNGEREIPLSAMHNKFVKIHFKHSANCNQVLPGVVCESLVDLNRHTLQAFYRFIEYYIAAKLQHAPMGVRSFQQWNCS